MEAETASADAARELAHARTTYQDMEPLLAEAFVTRAEFDRAEQALRRAEDRQRLAAARLTALVTFERPAATSQARSELSAARGALDRQGQSRRGARRVTTGDRGPGGKPDRRDRGACRHPRRPDRRATIRAQGPGLVVHRDLFFGTDQRKPQVGDEVFPNQALIALPDSAQMIVDTRIREVDLHKVVASQRVEVRVDAYPDLRLPASVALVGALAQEDATRAGTKLFL